MPLLSIVDLLATIDRVFLKYDTDNSGTLDMKEIIAFAKEFVQDIGLKHKEMKKEIKHYDKDEGEPEWGG
jgi:Ca2+-binding EF-hand superfamily protein